MQLTTEPLASVAPTPATCTATPTRGYQPIWGCHDRPYHQSSTDGREGCLSDEPLLDKCATTKVKPLMRLIITIKSDELSTTWMDGCKTSH